MDIGNQIRVITVEPALDAPRPTEQPVFTERPQPQPQPLTVR